jgi:hypothetical protein
MHERKSTRPREDGRSDAEVRSVHGPSVTFFFFLESCFIYRMCT